MRRRDLSLILVVAVGFAVLARWVGPGELAPPRLPDLASLAAAPARAAAPLALDDLAGRPHALAEHAGKIVLLNFWATWCPPCREEMPALESLHRELGPADLVVLGVSVDAGAPEDVAAFARRHGVSFPLLHDPGGETARRWGVVAYPTSFVLDRSGSVLHVVQSAWDWDHPDAVAWLRALLASPAGAGPQ